VRCRRGRRDGARDLRVLDLAGQEREWNRIVVTRLPLEALPIDGPAVEAGRRARLQAPHPQPEPIKPRRELEGGRLARAAGGNFRLAHVDQAVEEGAGRQHHRSGAEAPPVGRDNTPDPRAVDDQILDAAFDHREVVCVADRPLHRLPVKLAVGLGARALHGRSLRAVQKAELDAGCIRHLPHKAVESIDLAHEMALAEAADRGVARHLADGRKGMGDEPRARAHAGGCGRGLAAGMPAADDDHIE